MPLADLSAEQARELVHVKVVAPTLLTRAAVPGMLTRRRDDCERRRHDGLLRPRTGLSDAPASTGAKARTIERVS